jgi:hypothetical protein
MSSVPLEIGPVDPALSALRNLRATARALVIQIPGIPPGICGSCFAVGYRKRLFIVTAAHLTRGNLSQHVRVSPAGDLRNSFQLGAGVVVSPPDDPDGVDVIVYPTGLGGFDRATLAAARVINLDDSGVSAWQLAAYVSDFLVIGFPRPLNEVDYDRDVVKSAQVMLPGKYEAVSRADGHVHLLRVENPHLLGEFAGFSGGPVFSVEYHVGAPPSQRFCGLAITGSARSCLVHFVDVDAVRYVMDTAIEHLTGERALPGPRPGEL